MLSRIYIKMFYIEIMKWPDDRTQIINAALNGIYNEYKEKGQYVTINKFVISEPLDIKETSLIIERANEEMISEGLLDQNGVITVKGKSVAESGGYASSLLKNRHNSLVQKNKTKRAFIRCIQFIAWAVGAIASAIALYQFFY